MIELIGDICNRWYIDRKVVTVYKRVTGCESTAPIVTFGRKILYHATKRIASNRPKCDPPWLEGVYPGTL